MSQLLVEELEPRQLLSGAGFSARPSPAPPAAGPSSVRVAERPALVDFGGHAGPGEGGGMRPSRTIAPHFIERGPSGPGVHGEAHPCPGAARRGPQDSGDTWDGADVSSAGPDAGVGLTGSGESAGGRGASTAAAVSAVPAGGLNLPLPSLLEILMAGVRIGLPGPPAGRSAGAEWREPEVLAGVAGPSPRGPEPASPRSAVTPTEPARDEAEVEEALVLPPPHASGALPLLPLLDLPSLEHGLRQLLGQLERVGERLAPPRDGTGLCLWIVAGTAAAVACEIARRQLRSAAPAADADRWPGPPSDPLLAG